MPASPATLHWPAPAGAPGVLIVPGYGSRKENHRDFGKAVRAAGMAAAAVDLRGHGETGGVFGDGHNALRHDPAVIAETVALLRGHLSA